MSRMSRAITGGKHLKLYVGCLNNVLVIYSVLPCNADPASQCTQDGNFTRHSEGFGECRRTRRCQRCAIIVQSLHPSAHNVYSLVELNYTHFRPNGKATLTMEVPEYTSEALQQANSLMISGIQVIAEPIYDSLSNHAMARPLFGDGPSAGAFPFDTVSIAGVPGKTRVSEVQKMLSGFNVVNIKSVPL